jgi:hypothetical protein
MGVLAAGRLICDTYLAAREHLAKETTYRLTELAASQLGAVGTVASASATSPLPCMDSACSR